MQHTKLFKDKSLKRNNFPDWSPKFYFFCILLTLQDRRRKRPRSRRGKQRRKPPDAEVPPRGLFETEIHFPPGPDQNWTEMAKTAPATPLRTP